MIEDFSHRQGDTIDLSDLADSELAYLGGDAFTGDGVGEVRIKITGAGQVVQVDVDGDGSADLEILVRDGGLTGAEDFVL